jgi:hypothetical protein
MAGAPLFLGDLESIRRFVKQARRLGFSMKPEKLAATLDLPAVGMSILQLPTKKWSFQDGT